MRRLFTLILALCCIYVASAQVENAIIIDKSTFKPVNSGVLEGVNIDPIGVDSSRRPCARIKMKVNRMTREEINGLELKIGDMFRQVMPQDLVKFGLIPEFIGRVPVHVALDMLDEEALISILRDPKNALTKQYQKLFALDGVELEFEEDALRVFAKRALEYKTGARGLRSIMEKTLLETMYEMPSDESILKCIVTKESAEGSEQPSLLVR